MAAYVEIGYTLKKHGVQGEIKVNIKEEYASIVSDLDVLFFKQKQNYMPYFIDSIRSSKPYMFKFEDLDSPESLKPISSSAIFVKENIVANLIQEEPEKPDDEEDTLIGYTVIEEKFGEVGVVKELEEYPMQILLKVIKSQNEYLIPFNEDYIVEIDSQNKSIRLELPEGLLDLNK